MLKVLNLNTEHTQVTVSLQLSINRAYMYNAHSCTKSFCFMKYCKCYNDHISATMTPCQLHKINVNDLGQGTLHTVASYNDPIPLVCAPGFKQLPGQSALHHSRAGHDDTWSHIVKLVYTLCREERRRRRRGGEEEGRKGGGEGRGEGRGREEREEE